MYKKLTLKHHTGFTLVELLVSISIYAIVITMAVGSLMVLIDANAKAQNMQEAITNLTFALDSMTREIRTGRSFYCATNDPGASIPESDEFDTQDCDNGGSYFSIVEGGQSLTEDSDGRVAYRYNSTDQTIDRRVSGGNWFPITSPDVDISEGVFHVSDTDTGSDGDASQAYVTIYITGSAGELESVDTSFDIETTIVKRILDI